MTNPAAIRQTAAVDESDPWVSLNMAVEIRGKARVTLLLEALDGKIRSQKVAGRRFFHRADLEQLSAAPAADDGGEE